MLGIPPQLLDRLLFTMFGIIIGTVGKKAFEKLSEIKFSLAIGLGLLIIALSLFLGLDYFIQLFGLDMFSMSVIIFFLMLFGLILAFPSGSNRSDEK